jgi:uroporphyrinogen-III synthase
MQRRDPTLLITRPEPAGAEFAQSVRAALGRPVRVILSPVMAIEPVEVTLDAMPSALILTSVNGVEAARRAGLPKGLTAWCVGDRTAETAAAAGFAPISAKGDSSALVRAILARRPTGPMLHLHGAHMAGDVAEALTAAGIPCLGRVGYRQEPRDLTTEARDALGGTLALVVPLFSPRSVSILAKQGPFAAPVTVIAISGAVAKAAQILDPVQVIAAASPDGAAMCRAICAVFDTISLPTGP